jgi:phospholipid transport system transporter-binding protein
VTGENQVGANGFVTRHDGTVEISGRMTFETVPDFLRQTSDWLNVGSGALIIDLNRVSKTDSAGLALMVEWQGLARERGRALKYVNIPEQVQRIIHVSGLEQAFSGG